MSSKAAAALHLEVQSLAYLDADTSKVFSKNRPENDLLTVISTSYHCFTTVLMSVSVVGL